MQQQILTRPSSGKHGQNSEFFGTELRARRNDSKKNLVAELICSQAHSSNAPTLQFSSPHIEKIIKEAQNAMVLIATMVKQPLVTLNTSVFEVPS